MRLRQIAIVALMPLVGCGTQSNRAERPQDPAEDIASMSPRDAGRRDDPERHGHAERMRGVIDVARRAAGPDANGPRRRIDAHALHQ